MAPRRPPCRFNTQSSGTFFSPINNSAPSVNSEIAMIFHRSPGKKNTRVYVRCRPRALIGLVISGPGGEVERGGAASPDETRRLAKVTFEYERRTPIQPQRQRRVICEGPHIGGCLSGALISYGWQLYRHFISGGGATALTTLKHIMVMGSGAPSRSNNNKN
jgi:hypothetical protein